MITVWQLNAVVHKFALVTAGPDFHFWDWTAGAWDLTATTLDPAKHLKADQAPVPLGLRTVTIPDEARSADLVGLAVIPYRQSGTGWSAVEAIPINALPAESPVTINNSGTVNIGGY